MADNSSGARLMQSGYATWNSASTRALARAMGARLEELLTNMVGTSGANSSARSSLRFSHSAECSKPCKINGVQVS
jgi:hypothetical protein